MGKQTRALLCGNSVFMVGLEASLSGTEGLEVVRIEGGLADFRRRLHESCPDVIVLDLGAPHRECTLAILTLDERPGVPVVAVDPARSSATVLFTRCYATPTAEVLATVLRMAANDGVRRSIDRG